MRSDANARFPFLLWLSFFAQLVAGEQERIPNWQCRGPGIAMSFERFGNARRLAYRPPPHARLRQVREKQAGCRSRAYHFSHPSQCVPGFQSMLLEEASVHPKRGPRLLQSQSHFSVFSTTRWTWFSTKTNFNLLITAANVFLRFRTQATLSVLLLESMHASRSFQDVTNDSNADWECANRRRKRLARRTLSVPNCRACKVERDGVS